MSAHAFLAPSAAGRWVLCPGSAGMEAAFPSPESPESMDGTAAHWVLEHQLAAMPLSVGAIAPNGIAVTAEMVECADIMYRDIITTLGEHWRTTIRVEHRVHIPRVHPHNWGTPDVRAWVQTATGYTLYLWDFKYGRKHVEVFENWQLMDYALGCLSELNDALHAVHQPAISEASIQVYMRVVQPRSYHRDGAVRQWHTTADRLQPFAVQLAAAAMEATSPDAQCKPHPGACENCSARLHCAANLRAGYRAADLSQQAQVIDMTPEALGLELRILTDAQKLLKSRIEGLQERVLSNFRKGVHVPHWAMKPAASRLNWTVSDAEMVIVGDLLEVDLRKPVEVITPTQAKDKGIDRALIAAYSAPSAGAMGLAVDDGSEARRTFT